ncbi:MAG: MFS transporter permease [Desulfobacterales bacterium]|nr:MAG: MFS transporter permease [Desulfobacterales bacterium]
MAKKIKEIVIPKEEAVFWLDKNGCWHNENGQFEHKKIIHYFHSCIKKDPYGYYLYQAGENYAEKVYFPYEDQALFVFDVIQQNQVILVLNTGRKIKLKPRKLFIKNDCLYMQLDGEIIKFAEQGLFKIAQLMEEIDNRLYIRVKNRRYQIPTRDESADKEDSV